MPWLSKRFILPTWLWFLLLLVGFELIADILARQFGLTGKVIFGVLSILGYVLANLAWLFSLRSGAELGKGSIIFSALSGVGAVLLGLLVYLEKVNPYRLIGVVLGIAAIIFLSIEQDKFSPRAPQAIAARSLLRYDKHKQIWQRRYMQRLSAIERGSGHGKLLPQGYPSWQEQDFVMCVGRIA
jgi:multidrug transporter EmrE-like cation transporter